MTTREGGSRAELPYLNNLRLVLTITLINLPIAFIFQYNRLISRDDLLIDAALCGLVSAFSSLWFTKRAVNIRRAQGALPARMPISPFMQKLPCRLLPLSALLGLAASAAMALMTLVLISFFPETSYTFPRFLVWKIFYASLLAERAIAFGIFRFVQPDCQTPADPPQTGRQTVKNPLPRRDMLLRLYQSVTTDFGMNLLMCLALGGTLIRGEEVVLVAVHQDSVWISGLILGLIITLLMVRPTLCAVRQLALQGVLPPAARGSRLLRAIPENPWLFSALLLLPVMAASAVSIWGIFRFFGFQTLNFFQYFAVRTLYTKLLAKPVESLAVLRYRQPPPA